MFTFSEHDRQGAQTFNRNFAGYLAREGWTASQIRQYVWRAHTQDELKLTGPERDLDFARLEVSERDVQADIDAKPANALVAGPDFYRQQKTVLVLVPGFTHETLRYLSFHEEMHRRGSQHSVVMLQPGSPGQTRETVHSEGDGLRVVYAKYPRSNAKSESIAEPFFNLLHGSATLRRWVEQEGCKLFFIGYSYGCPLSLELFANLNYGRFADEFILKNTRGFLGLCGAVGGSYLADDLMRPTSKLLYVPKLVDFCRRHPFIGKLLGLPDKQFQDDMEGGVVSLTREERARRMQAYAPQLPGHLMYFSISAIMPLTDYRRRWWQFNFDDWTMWVQAKVSDPISVYNDGQVVAADTVVPRPAHIPASQFVHLGAVRAHHWAVSYKTFNLGFNRFPRRAFYRALIQTVHEMSQAR